MNKRKIRNQIRLAMAVLFSWLYIFHLLFYIFCANKEILKKDLRRKEPQIGFDNRLPGILLLLYFLHNDEYFRTWFYYRIGPAKALLISWMRPGCRTFSVSYTTKVADSVLFAHPYATVLNAERIGKNFSFLHCTTLGAKDKARPVIGDNVTLGAAVTIIGPVTIGNDVTVGAGSVVVKDVPDGCIVAGNPARIIRHK